MVRTDACEIFRDRREISRRCSKTEFAGLALFFLISFLWISRRSRKIPYASALNKKPRSPEIKAQSIMRFSGVQRGSPTILFYKCGFKYVAHNLCLKYFLEAGGWTGPYIDRYRKKNIKKKKISHASIGDGDEHPLAVVCVFDEIFGHFERPQAEATGAHNHHPTCICKIDRNRLLKIGNTTIKNAFSYAPWSNHR